MRAHQGRLSNTAFGLTKDRFKAEDLIQENFLKAYLAFDRFKPATSSWGWLSSIMVNTLISSYHPAKREVSGEDLGCGGGSPGSQADTEATYLSWPRKELLSRLLRNQMRNPMDKLPENYCQAAQMYDLQGYSYRQIALIISWSLGRLKSRLFRGRQRLKDNFGGHSRFGMVQSC